MSRWSIEANCVGLVCAPSRPIASENATTAGHLRASESLMHIGIGSELFHQTLVPVLALYRLFNPIHEQRT